VAKRLRLEFTLRERGSPKQAKERVMAGSVSTLKNPSSLSAGLAK